MAIQGACGTVESKIPNRTLGGSTQLLLKTFLHQENASREAEETLKKWQQAQRLEWLFSWGRGYFFSPRKIEDVICDQFNDGNLGSLTFLAVFC